MTEHEVQFGTLQEDGTVTNVRMIKQADIGRCPFYIFMPDHYREDGTCKCSNAEHRAIMQRPESKGGWGYKARDFTNIPLVD